MEAGTRSSKTLKKAVHGWQKILCDFKMQMDTGIILSFVELIKDRDFILRTVGSHGGIL